MKISNPAHQEILHQINLINLDSIDNNEFAGYTPFAYRNSETEAMDEVYRMHEHVLLHKRSGLRMSYLSTESYDGQTVEYTVINCFVITLQNQKYSVKKIDMEKQTFETTAGILPFHDVRNTVEKGD